MKKQDQIKPSLDSLAAAIRSAPSFAGKCSIGAVARQLGAEGEGTGIMNGDDAAAIPDGDGYLLLAAEGIAPWLVQADPYLAGRSAVLANVNDIYAMGGRPLAMVDVICNGSAERTSEILRGMQDNASRFGVPLVGGHTTEGSGDTSVSLAILGRANRLLTSFDARPGDRLLLAYNPQGVWLEAHGFWNSNGGRSDCELRGDLELLPHLAETGLCCAAKDVSMAGIAGTSLMLAESSGLAARLDLDRIIPPGTVPLQQWLVAFFSYGFLLAVRPTERTRVQEVFSLRGLEATDIGGFIPGSQLVLSSGGMEQTLWDWSEQPFTGFRR